MKKILPLLFLIFIALGCSGPQGERDVSTTLPPGPTLTLLQTKSVNSSRSFITVTGTVRNNTDDDLSKIHPVAITYDKDGTVIQTHIGMLDFKPLPANGTGTFYVVLPREEAKSYEIKFRTTGMELVSMDGEQDDKK